MNDTAKKEDWDLVDRMRSMARACADECRIYDEILWSEAADEIERLRGFEGKNYLPPDLAEFPSAVDELKARRDFMISRGYRFCSIPACNCNSWHGGHAEDRLTEACDERDELRTSMAELCKVFENIEETCRISRDLTKNYDRL